MSKRLVIMRHAHRDTAEHFRDNGLSQKGEDQVKKLVKFVTHQLKDQDPYFFSSPKKRCLETITPISKEFSKKVEVDERLSEQGPNETRSHYESRIEEFMDFFKHEAPDLTVICSHGDFIPVLIEKMTRAKTGLKKAGYAEIEYVSGEAYLTWLVQKV